MSERFRAQNHLSAGNLVACLPGDCARLFLSEIEGDDSIILDVQEARALRDWLNQALPDQVTGGGGE